MSRAARRLRGARVTFTQLALISAISAAVSAVIVISALGEAGPERAIIAALHTRKVIHEIGPASAPVSAPATSATVPAATPAPSPVAAAPSLPAPATSSAPSAASAASDSSGDGSSDGGSGSSTGAGGGGSGSSTEAAGSGSGGSGSGDAQPAPRSKVKHVFVIMLSTSSYATAFGAGSAAHYLNSKLRPRGELLSNYQTLGGAPLPDYIAAVSGQAPNSDTSADCPRYNDFAGGAAPGKNGLVRGSGCVYPNTALTIGDQLDSAALRWRAYVEGMSTPCEHPNSGGDITGTAGATGTAGTTSTTGPSDTSAYTPISNPFVFFHSLLDLGDCQSDDLPYGRLANALRSAQGTPSYAFISPDPCDSGAALTCPGARPGARPGGIAAADAFLRRAVPGILASPAYRTSGMLLVVFTVPPPTTGQATGGPVRTGALQLSPFTRSGTSDGRSYTPYSVLRTVEHIFGLSALGRAKTTKAFDPAAATA